MTQKVYKTARGLQVDIGSLRLQNENIRAVGNMGVNARGDRIDPYNNVIDSRNQQLQRRINRQTNVSDGPVHTSMQDPTINQGITPDVFEEDEIVEEKVVEEVAPVAVAPVAVAPVSADPALANVDSGNVEESGLAAAIARAKTVKQELEKTQRQKQQTTGVRKI